VETVETVDQPPRTAVLVLQTKEMAAVVAAGLMTQVLAQKVATVDQDK
jgi:hypothetical protein